MAGPPGAVMSGWAHGARHRRLVWKYPNIVRTILQGEFLDSAIGYGLRSCRFPFLFASFKETLASCIGTCASAIIAGRKCCDPSIRVRDD